MQDYKYNDGDFNPRSSGEERRAYRPAPGKPKEISIHAPRVRSDAPTLSAIKQMFISIHAPRVRSDNPCPLKSPREAFQSTLLG